MEQIEFEEQHPIPQQISAYHFRLVGDMTLKQFFEVAAGAIIALIIYSTALHPIIKVPLILISFAAGILFAFVPLQDRPLEKWLYLFFKSIYSPTLFVWKQSATPVEYFQPEDQGIITPIQPQTPAVVQTLSDEQPAVTPVQEEAHEAMTQLEEKEQEFLTKIGGTQTTPEVQISDQPPLVSKQKTEIAIPNQVAVDLDKTAIENQLPPDNAKPEENVGDSTRLVSPFAQESTPLTGNAPSFIPDASPPTPPTQPNIIVGQITDPNGKIIDGAIMDIRDEYGRPARALKSNKLGHFMIATPLSNGKYNMTIDKDGYSFEPISFEAVGAVIPPISIIGKITMEQSADFPSDQQKN